MRPFDRLRAAWGNLGVTAKLGLGFALLFCMILVEAAASLIALGEVRRAEAVILTSVEIRQRIFEMDGQLEKARRLHRDFFLQYPRIGFLPAQELYFHPATEVIAQVVALSGELKRLVDTSGVSEALRDRSNDLTLYLNTATRFSAIFQDLIALVTTLAAPETGLESQIHALENAIGDYSEHSPQTLLPFQKMVLHHRRYTITRQRPDMQSALNACNELRRAIATDHGFKPAAQTKALRLLARYATVAKQIPDIDMAIRGKLNDFTLQARAVDPISENLKAIATQEVERANNRIVLASRISAGVIILMAVVGLGFVLLVAAILHASVTRKLVALTHFAEQMRAGNFETAVDLNSHDEVGILAASFKDMAERMRSSSKPGAKWNNDPRNQPRPATGLSACRRTGRQKPGAEILSVTDRLTGWPTGANLNPPCRPNCCAHGVTARASPSCSLISTCSNP
jgi:HAMP domain-containing protein